MKRAVFTVLFGRYDDINHLLEFEIMNQDFHKFIITDRKIPQLNKTSINQIVVNRRFNDSLTESRYYKFNVFEFINAEEYIYFDANRRLNHEVLQRIFDLGGGEKFDIMHFHHPKNNDYSQEVYDCLKQKKISDNVYEKYLNLKVDIDALTAGVDLTENSIFYFKNNITVKVYLNSIFGLFMCFSPRDQLASVLVRSVIYNNKLNIGLKRYEEVSFVNNYFKHSKKNDSFFNKVLILIKGYVG